MKSTRVRYHSRKTRSGMTLVREHDRLVRANERMIAASRKMDASLQEAAPDLYNAVGVIVLDKRINKWLLKNDAKALEQAKKAFAKAGGKK
jgi:hypothetical protein